MENLIKNLLKTARARKSRPAEATSLLTRAGFTLMEMLIVMAIIGMIMAFVGTKIFSRFDQAKVDSTKTQMRLLMTVLDDFRRVCNFYPTTDQGLEALVHAPQGRECKNYDPEGFIKRVPNDGWDRPFMYQSDGTKYQLKSLGADGAEGGDGINKDISSDDL